MEFQVIDSRYFSDKNTNVMFATSEKQEAIIIANEIGSGTVVVQIDESGLKEIVYISGYKTELGLVE